MAIGSTITTRKETHTDMALFDNLATPPWLTNAQIFDNPNTPPVVDSFMSAYAKGAQATKDKQGDTTPLPGFLAPFQDQKVSEERHQEQLAKNAQAQMMSKWSNMIPQMANAKSPTDAAGLVADNPNWLVDPQTAPGVGNWLKSKVQEATVQKNSLQGQIAIKDSTDFLKRLQTIDPTSRAAIQGMSPNKDGSISAMQWQALGLAEQSTQAQKDNAALQAGNEATARGDVPTTVVGPKGVTTTYKPATAQTGANAGPQEMVLSDGTRLEWMPGGKSIHVISANKKDEKDMTTTQLESLGKSLLAYDSKDTYGVAIMHFLGKSAVKQISKSAPKAMGGYKIGTVYKGGLKYLGGDPNDQSNWETVK